MSATYLDAVTPRTPTVENHERGQVFALDAWSRLRRWLIMGSEAGTFYVRPRELTIQFVDVVKECLDLDAVRTINEITEVSQSGIAVRNDQAILALAIMSVHQDVGVRKAAFDQLPKVCRYGTHLFHFFAYRKALRGGHTHFSRMYRRAASEWYAAKGPMGLAREVTKYPSRDGVSHRDILILGHPKPKDKIANSIFDYVIRGALPLEIEVESSDAVDEFARVASFLHAVECAKLPKGEYSTASMVTRIINHKLTWEMLNTEWLSNPEIWAALLVDMPIEAMVRNLGRMSANGLLKPAKNRTKAVGVSDEVRMVIDRLRDKDRLVRARIHPIKLLIALRTYSQGHGDKGSLTWAPVAEIENALDDAIYLSFAAVEPTGKTILACVDTSGSMDQHNEFTGLTAREIATMLGLVTYETEPHAEVIGFCDTLFTPKMRRGMHLKDAVAEFAKGPSGGTWCSLPIFDALKRKASYDAFAFYTDSETFDGRTRTWMQQHYRIPTTYTHPTDLSFSDHLRDYRRNVNRHARSIVVACQDNEFSLNDPLDPLGLDVAGFSPEVPAVVSAFTAGRM